MPSGRVISGPPGGNYWRVSEDNFKKMVADNRIWWGKQGDSIPQIKRFLSEVKQGVTPQTFWPYEEVGHTQEAKQEILKLFGQDVFLTPKPERLMSRVIQTRLQSGRSRPRLLSWFRHNRCGRAKNGPALHWN